MKAVILAGGLGTRLSEETVLRPKPMVEIGGMPILWHIMKYYSNFGINDFIICCGYKGYMIKEYFINYFMHISDINIDLSNNNVSIQKNTSENWKISLVDTGDLTMTGGRLLRVKDYLRNEENFCFTYGDGLSNVDIGKLINFHCENRKYATVTAVMPPGRYGALDIFDKTVNGIHEKPKGDGGFINGGYFVLNKEIFNYIENDSTVWEESPMQKLIQDNHLMAFKHEGFWQPMDTIREKNLLDELWCQGKAPWKMW